MTGPSPWLIGRQTHLDEASLAVDRTAQVGAGRVLHLDGDPDLGKRPLAAAITEYAESCGFTVGWGRPTVPGHDAPFATWARALERTGARAAAEQLTSDRDLDRARRWLLQHLSGPTMLVLSDLHRADDCSRWLVDHLLDDLHDRPLIVLITTDADAAPAVIDDLRRWRTHRNATRLLVHPLSTEESAQLLSVLTDSDIDPLHPLVSMADGSPVVAHELADRWGHARGRAEILEDITDRFAAADLDGVLTVIAIVSRPATDMFIGSAKPSTVARYADVDVDAVLKVIQAAGEAGFVIPSATSGYYELAHQIYVDAAMLDVVAVARIRRRIAERLLNLAAMEESGSATAEAAWQLIKAGQPDVEVSVQAADWYLSVGQPKDAVDVVSGSLSVMLSDAEQFVLDRRYARAKAALGMWDRPRPDMMMLASRARTLGLADEFVDTVADLLVWCPTVPDASRRALIGEALDRVEAGGIDPLVGIRLWAGAVRALDYQEPQTAAAIREQLRQVDLDAIPPPVAVEVLATEVLRGTVHDLARMVSAIRRLDAMGDKVRAAPAYAALGRVGLALLRGTRDEIDRAIIRADAAIADWPAPELATYLTSAKLAVARMNADVGAYRELSTTPGWLKAPPNSDAATMLGITAMLWRQALGGTLPISPAAENAVRPHVGPVRATVEITLLGIQAILNPDLADALRERLEQLRDEVKDMALNFQWLGGMVSLAGFAGRAGDVELANRAADMLEPYIDHMAVIFPSYAGAPVGLYVAHARITAGDVEGGARAVDAAIRCAQRLRAPSWHGMCLIVQARVAMLAGNVEWARASLAEARTLLEAHDSPVMHADLDRLDADVDDLQEKVSYQTLSSREVEVLRLVATGATNREVARSLDISPKTVEFHLASTFRALGAGNRTEAVELARRARIL